MFPAFLTTLLFAGSAVFAARSARLVGVTAANMARLWLAGVLLALWAHGRGAGLGGGAAALGTFFLSGAVGFGLGDLALFAALPRIGSRLTVLLVQCLAVPVAATLEWGWMGTSLTFTQVACITLILAGVALAVAPEAAPGHAARPDAMPSRGGRSWRIGLCFGVVAAFGQAVGAVISRRGFALAEAAGVHLDGGTAAYQRILGGLAVMTFAYGVGAWRRRGLGTVAAEPGRWRRGWPWVVVNSLAGPILGVSCYQWALATTPSALVLPIVATTPLVVVPLAYVLEGERPGRRSLVGGAVAVAGAVALAVWR